MLRAVRTLAFILCIICMGVIIYFSFSSKVDIPQFLSGTFKIGHCLAYVALSFLLFVCFSDFNTHRFFAWNILPMVSSFLLASLFGYAVELCQPYFGRHFALTDMLSDCAGAFIGTVIGFFCVLFMCTIERKRTRS
ncbi:MAG: VanZ family protein [Spirochaetales bacterium]|nr:VanZ family protein [Spirochaetales bacterium]